MNKHSGEAKLSDFGASFFYGGADAPHAAQYQAMEARAYGLLLEELIARHDGLGSEKLTTVRSVAAICTDVHPTRRPSFSKVVQTLEAAFKADILQ